MKVLILVNEFPPGPGGIGTHAFEIARHLHLIGHEVDVVCSQNYVEIEKVAEFNRKQPFSIHSYRHSRPYLASVLRRLRLIFRVIRQTKPYVLIASGSNSLWVGALLNTLFLRSFKLVVVAHGGEMNFKSSIRRMLTEWACGRAHKIVAVSNYTKNFIPAKLNSLTTVIHNGADSSVFHTRGNQDELKTANGFAGRKVILTVGSVSERKGQDIVIKALKHLRTNHPEILYLMAGRSNNFSYYQSLIKSEKVEGNAELLGPVDVERLVELYNMADVYVLASRHSSDGDFEGFGISVIEAALCGVPAVVTSNSGLVEAIDDQVTGLAVPPENPHALAKAISRLLTDNPRSTMGLAAKQRAQNHFTWERVALSYDRMLRSLS